MGGIANVVQFAGQDSTVGKALDSNVEVVRSNTGRSDN